jgi:hypothetical protein
VRTPDGGEVVNLAVEPYPEAETRYAHTCEDGHTWIEQPDGGVAPEWAFGGTSIHYDQPPDRCPDPERGYSRYTDADGNPIGPFHGYKCPSCGAVHYAGGCLRGVRCDPWNTPEPECEPPPVACGKPSVKRERWMRVKRMLAHEVKGKPGTYEKRPTWCSDWVEVNEHGAATAAEVREPSLF